MQHTMYMMNIQDNKQSNTIQHNTPTPKTAQREMSYIPPVGFEPTTLCSLDECSSTEGAQMARVQITNTTQYNARQGVSMTWN